MRGKLGGLLAALSLASNPGAALAQQPNADTGLDPSGKWIANFDADSCALSRDFGTGEAQVNLVLRPMPEHPLLQMVVMYHKQYSVPPAIPGTPNLPARLTLLPAGTTVKGDYADLPLPPGAFAYEKALEFYFPRAELGALGDAQLLKFEIGRTTVALRPTAMAAAVNTLAACEDDLVKSWGFDPAVVHGVAKRPVAIGATGAWLTKSDYRGPRPAMAFNLRSALRYKVDEQGMVSDCHIVQSSGTPQFDQTACAMILKRARYKPALDKDGKPVATLVTTKVSLPLVDLPR